MATAAKNKISQDVIDLITQHGLWTDRDTWVHMTKDEHAAFYNARREFLHVLEQMRFDFDQFERDSSKLTKKQPDGSNHEVWSQIQSTKWMHNYEKLQKKYQPILRALNAMLGHPFDVSQQYHIHL